MNLPRESAIAAMDLLTKHGYTAHLEAAVIPHGASEVLYRISVPSLSFDAVNLRELCDIADRLGLECRLFLQQIRFDVPKPEGRDRL
jgi:hypothetical protein